MLMTMILSSATVHGSQDLQCFGSDKGKIGNINISVNVNEGNPVVVCASATNDNSQASSSQPVQEAIPPMSASLEPKRLRGFFCRMWKDENYESMYLCMTRQYQHKTPFQKFTALFEADADRTGGLEDENILAEDGENGAGHLVVVDLKFRRKKAPNRRVKALLEKTKDGYRIMQSGILPLDFDNL